MVVLDAPGEAGVDTRDVVCRRERLVIRPRETRRAETSTEKLLPPIKRSASETRGAVP
jgi:hypothetical protein